jgi:serine/threonine protein kinase
MDELERLRAEVETLRFVVRSLEGAPSPSSALEIPFDELDLRDRVGGGGYSVVYRALWRGTPVAVKRWLDPHHSERALAEFRREVMTAQDLRHPHCVQLLGHCSSPQNPCIVFEHLPFTLHGVLHGGGAAVIDRKRALSFALDIARALAHLHSRRPAVIHRDVKPANFLVDRAYKVKLCDFGLCDATDADAGTPNYMAPELLAKKPYAEKVDVYAFGVVMWEMLAREVPFDGLAAGEIKRSVLEGRRPEMPLSVPGPTRALVVECWDQDAGKRPGCDAIIDRLNALIKAA